jgi:hypothetical protein
LVPVRRELEDVWKRASLVRAAIAMRVDVYRIDLRARQRRDEQTPSVARQREVVGAQTGNLQAPKQPVGRDAERGDVSEISTRDVEGLPIGRESNLLGVVDLALASEDQRIHRRVLRVAGGCPVRDHVQRPAQPTEGARIDQIYGAVVAVGHGQDKMRARAG